MSATARSALSLSFSLSVTVGDWGNIHDTVIGYPEATPTEFQGRGKHGGKSSRVRDMMRESYCVHAICYSIPTLRSISG